MLGSRRAGGGCNIWQPGPFLGQALVAAFPPAERGLAWDCVRQGSVVGLPEGPKDPSVNLKTDMDRHVLN